jgi:hypothetical protein
LWITSAGNDRQAHWGGAFNDPDGDDYHNYTVTGNINYLGPGDGSAYIIPPGIVVNVFLRWDDWTVVNQDYDIRFLRNIYSGGAFQGWQNVANSYNVQDGGPGQKPVEYISYADPIYSAAYGFVIERYDSTRNVNLEVHLPQLARLNYILNDRSLFNLADAPSVMTVAALDVVDPYTHEYYSSQGPTNGLGGPAVGGFTKPDISGFANVSTVSYGTLNKFSGTSSATTHVAGAAALVLSAYPAYSPDQLQTFLETHAVDMGSAGMDNIYGYGRLYLGAPPSIGPTEHFTYLPLVMTGSLFSYYDDFSDPSSGWGSGDTSDFIYRYLSGEYQIYFKLTEKGFGITPDLILPSDYRIEVDARKLSPGVCSYGLLFGTRFTSDSWETYQVLIWPTDQDFLVEKRSLDGTWTTIQDWTENTAIHLDTASNHIRVDRIGTAIKIYINGVLVADLIDSSFTGPGRDAGIRAYSYYDAPVDIRFDNFSASIP